MHFEWKHTYHTNPNISIDLALVFSGKINHLQRKILIHNMKPYDLW